MRPADFAAALGLLGDGSLSVKIVVLAIIVAAILFTRLGPRGR
jgi:hypothetical protein